MSNKLSRHISSADVNFSTQTSKKMSAHINEKEVFTSLIADIKEHLVYLRELGVEQSETALSETFIQPGPEPSEETRLPLKKVPSKHQPQTPRTAPKETTEQLALARNALAAASLKDKTSTKQSFSADEQQSALKIARTSSANTNETSNLENKTQTTMATKSKVKNEPSSHGDSLFGDIAPTNELPESNETLEDIRNFIGDCTRCKLCEGRTHVVNSEGNPKARLMFVGEAPGADEDAQARPFVGRAGQLLNKIIEAIGMKREDVFIGNVNRCRPPGNRAPMPDEAATCKPFLMREIAVVRPDVIVVLGNTAMKNLLNTKEGITKVRGVFQDFQGVKVMPTFHPAYLLRDPSKKRETWEDMKKVRDYLKSKEE